MTPRDQGQATVEFALVLPLIVMCLLLIPQTLVLVTSNIALHHQVRVTTRAAAISANPTAAGIRTRPGDLIDVSTTDRLVTVRIRRPIPVMVPLVARFLPEVVLSSSLTMALEPPVHEQSVEGASTTD